MKKTIQFLVIAFLAICFIGCKNDDGGGSTVTPKPEDSYKGTGFLISASVSTSNATTWYGKYSAEKPTGSINLADGTPYQRFQMKAKMGKFIYGYRTDNQPGLVKYSIDKDEKLIELGSISTLAYPSKVMLINETKGYFGQYGSKEVTMFNPTTMEITGQVDMTGAHEAPKENTTNGYSVLVYNKTTEKIYAVLYTDNPDTPPFYDETKVYVEVINTSTNRREKTIVKDDAAYPIMRGNINSIIDEQGNTYLLCQGSYGLDGKFGPTAPKASRPQVIKINTSSEFDESYSFNPVNKIGFENNFFQLMTSMIYGGNNTAFAYATAQSESPEILALLQKYAAGTLTSDELNTLRFLVLNDESMKLIQIDLVNQTAKEVEGSPLNAGFAYPYMQRAGNKIYAPISSEKSTFTGFYEIDIPTNTAKKLVKISSGGSAIQCIDLSYDF